MVIILVISSFASPFFCLISFGLSKLNSDNQKHFHDFFCDLSVRKLYSFAFWIVTFFTYTWFLFQHFAPIIFQVFYHSLLCKLVQEKFTQLKQAQWHNMLRFRNIFLST